MQIRTPTAPLASDDIRISFIEPDTRSSGGFDIIRNRSICEEIKTFFKTFATAFRKGDSTVRLLRTDIGRKRVVHLTNTDACTPPISVPVPDDFADQFDRLDAIQCSAYLKVNLLRTSRLRFLFFPKG